MYNPLTANPSSERGSHQQMKVFVGRAGALQRINGSSKPSLVLGPAGIGKTAFARHVAQQSPAATIFAADGVQMRASYHPFTRWIMHETQSNLPGFADISTRFTALPDPSKRALALILGLPEGQQLLTEQSNVALKALIEESLWMAIRATQAQGVLIFEDLHWFDSASFGVLSHIIQSKAASHYQILMTSREDAKIDRFLGKAPININALEPLSDRQADDLLKTLSQGKATANQRAYLIAHAGGIPLFIEQILRRDALNNTPRFDVPDTLKDLLAEQIDATGAAKPVLQAASVIGRRFDLATLRAIAADHDPLEGHLDTACRQGVLQKDGQDSFSFAHALLQQTAYQGMLRQTRIRYHAQIAAYLEKHHPDAVMRNPALLTNHLSLSQQHIPAIQNYLTVSRRALLQGGFEDAEAHVLAAISLCENAPADTDLRALEIACYAALGSIRMQVHGFTATPVKDAFEKVSTLAKGQTTYCAANGPAFYGSFTHAVISGDKATARQFSEMLRDAAVNDPDGDQNKELRIASLNVDTSLHFYAGDFAKASTAYQQLQSDYDIARHGAMISSYGADTYGAAQMFECVIRSICGDAHLIPGLSVETDAHQELLNIPVMQPWAQIWGAVPLYYAGKTDRAVARVRRGIETATRQSAGFWQMTGAAWLNVMDTSETYHEDGLGNFHAVIKAHEAMGARVGLPYFRAHYAIALAKHDRLDHAYQASLQATRENEANGLHCWYPEVLRLHAQICEQCGGPRGAARFRKEAADIATRQNALLWLLRVRVDQHRAGEIGDAELEDLLNRLDPAARPPEVRFAHHLLNKT